MILINYFVVQRALAGPPVIWLSDDHVMQPIRADSSICIQ